MYLDLFHRHFPQLAEDETRYITLEGGPSDRPPGGQYVLVESYCTDPTCDCRRVLLNVLKKDQGQVATIGFGFDRTGPMPGPYHDPLNPQAEYAEEVLDLVKSLCLSDAAYVARLERHYNLMKDKLGRPGTRRAASNAGAPWWKRKRKKPRRLPPRGAE